MPASLLTLPLELLNKIISHLALPPDRPFEILSCYGPLDYQSRQDTVYVEPAQIWKERFGNNLLALSKTSKLFHDLCYPFVFAERHIEDIFDKVDLGGEDPSRRRLVRSLKVICTVEPEDSYISEDEDSEDGTSDGKRIITPEDRSRIVCRNLQAFPRLTSLSLDDVYPTEDTMRVLADMRELRALSVTIERAGLQVDYLPPVWVPPLPSLRSLCIKSSFTDMTFLARAAYHNLQELRLLTLNWKCNTDFISVSHTHFPRLRRLTLKQYTGFRYRTRTLSSLRQFVHAHRGTLEELNISSGGDTCLSLSWVHYITNILCGNLVEEWEGMDGVDPEGIDDFEFELRESPLHYPWGRNAVLSFGCVVHEHDGPSSTRDLVEFGIQTKGSISEVRRMLNEHVFKPIQRLSLITKESAGDDAILKNVFDDATTLCVGLPQLRAFSLHLEIIDFTIKRTSDDIPSFYFPIYWRQYYRFHSEYEPYSSVNWASYPLKDGFAKLVEMWANEELPLVRSFMHGLMHECKALDIIQWWLGDGSDKSVWVWRRVGWKLKGAASLAGEAAVTNVLLTPASPTGPRRNGLSAYVGKAGDLEYTLL